jgi:dienelactone hydrolase
MAAAVVEPRPSENLGKPGPATADIEDAIAWLRARASELGLDDDRVAIWGFGSGVPLAFRAPLLGSPMYLRALVSYYGVLRIDAPAAALRVGGGRAAPSPLLDHSPVDLLGRGLRVLPPILVVRPGRVPPGVQAAADAFLAAAQTRKAVVTVLEHAAGREGFDFLDDDPRSREVLQATYEFLKTSLAPPPGRRGAR